MLGSVVQGVDAIAAINQAATNAPPDTNVTSTTNTGGEPLDVGTWWDANGVFVEIAAVVGLVIGMVVFSRR
jgi:hypothetical protein